MLASTWEDLIAEERLEDLNRRVVEASEQEHAGRARRDEAGRLLEVGQNSAPDGEVQGEENERLVA